MGTIGHNAIDASVRNCLRHSLSSVFEGILEDLEIPVYVRELYTLIDAQKFGCVGVNDFCRAGGQNPWLQSYVGDSAGNMPSIFEEIDVNQRGLITRKDLQEHLKRVHD